MQAQLTIDNSVFIAWLLPDENDLMAEAAFDLLQSGKAVAHVPPLLYTECMNVLLMANRKQRITAADLTTGIGFLHRFKCQIDSHFNTLAVLDDIAAYAQRYSLTAYDATYLELARRTGSALVTLDRQLAAAASQEGLLFTV